MTVVTYTLYVLSTSCIYSLSSNRGGYIVMSVDCAHCRRVISLPAVVSRGFESCLWCAWSIEMTSSSHVLLFYTVHSRVISPIPLPVITGHVSGQELCAMLCDKRTRMRTLQCLLKPGQPTYTSRNPRVIVGTPHVVVGTPHVVVRSWYYYTV